jgi:hypothetical protein
MLARAIPVVCQKIRGRPHPSERSCGKKRPEESIDIEMLAGI